MTFHNFLSKLNWRLILIHFIACWLFMYAFAELMVLHDFRFKMSLRDISLAKAQVLPGDSERFMEAALWANLSYIIGLLAALIISLIVSYKKHWYWLNSLLAYGFVFELRRFHLSGWQYLRAIFLTPGKLFSDDTQLYYLANGLVMLILGLLLFFSKISIHFISSKPGAKVNPQTQ